MKTNGSAPADVHATTRATKFSLAANYDPKLVPALASYPVDEVYGKFPTDCISGGRPRYLATPLSEADLRNCIRLLDRQGIAFNYLLNGACFGNREWTRPWQRQVTSLLTKLGEIGVRRVDSRATATELLDGPDGDPALAASYRSTEMINRAALRILDIGRKWGGYRLAF